MFMGILEVKNLTKQYGSFKAVDNLTFELEEGEILGLLGPNGAGKTTTIQMLLGVLTPTRGEVVYFGKPLLANRGEIMEKVNFSSTYTHLPWRLTVKENLTFLSYLYTIKNRKKRVDKLIEIFKLEKLLNIQMSGLSAGQITRVNLAKAFINFPKVLLLDEPTASLDPDVAQYIHEFLQNQKSQFNVSIIFTSHNMTEVEELCDRVVFLHNGRLIANDKPINLSKTIEICHIKLLITKKLKEAETYFNKLNLTYNIDGKYVVVDSKENEIPRLLKDLMDKEVEYAEISIAKPSLQDYFLAMANKK
jgi:ABC-2 type transport system ATP-binding protein